MLSVQEINMLKAQNEGLIKQNKELQAENRKLKRKIEKPIPNNNYERIKRMTVDEMAEHYLKMDKAIFEGARRGLAENGIEISGFDEVASKEMFKQWLLAEVEG